MKCRYCHKNPVSFLRWLLKDPCYTCEYITQRQLIKEAAKSPLARSYAQDQYLLDKI